jgi:hypothetical protein
MLTLVEYLAEQYAIQISEKRQKMLREGLETTPAELMYDLSAMNPKSLTARIVTDNDDELILSLQLKKSK